MNAQRKIETPQSEPDVDAFAAELSELSRRYGIAITDTPRIFFMEKDDYVFSYGCDDEGRLTLG